MELKEGAVIADRFRLVRLLGQGGMGEVWAAQHTQLDIPCAVKFIHAESAQKPEVRVRFEREAKAAAQLRSNNVVQILDYGVFEDTPYIAMEYLDGEPLNVRLKRRGRLDAHETFRIIAGVGKALSKAHVAGVVHRDLKPENIFLVRDEEGETPKVLDFGVAKQADELNSNTKTGALLGTPYFMSPEQAQGTKTIDYRADLWSLAVVVFRCVTGELPFKSTALGDLLIKIVTSPIPVPSHVAPGVPDSFDAWWAKAAQRDPNRRFQSAKELVESLGVSLGVSMPTHLGQTPMPGSPTGHRPMAHSAPDIPLDATAAMVGPSPGELPFAAVGSQPSHPGRTGLGPQPYSPMGGAPVGMAPHSMGSAGMSSGVQPMPGMGDSNAYPTVGGVAAPSNPRSSTMVAVIGAVLALVIAGGFGVFFATMRNADDAANAADGEDATSASAVVDDEPPPATSDDAEPSASDDSASSEVEQDTAPDAGASATPSARPTPAPRGRRSRPPKPAGTFDPGF